MPELRRRQHGRRGTLPRLLHVADDDTAIDDQRLALTTMARAVGLGVARAVALAVVLAAAPGPPHASPGVVLGADPTPDPGAAPLRPPTCAERFPEEGPAGVDLKLGCIVSEVVGLYTPDAPPPPLSTYAILVGIVITAGVLLVWVVGRMLAHRAGRRLAPVLADAWWVCGRCRSVNGAGVEHCYSCGAGRPDGPMLTTSDRPEIPQSFGSTRKRG